MPHRRRRPSAEALRLIDAMEPFAPLDYEQWREAWKLTRKHQDETLTNYLSRQLRKAQRGANENRIAHS